MLRAAFAKPSVARWSPFRHPQSRWLRKSSSKTSETQPKEWLPSRQITWPKVALKRIERRRSQIDFLLRLTPAALAAFLFVHIETTYFYAIDFTLGISMLPTINSSGDSVIISKLYRRGKGVHVGDVVSFDHPVDQGVQSIKRVVGVEGDWVCRDTPGIGTGVMIQVPKGHCWVVGDNLSWSRDSRLFGPLPMALIKGKVLARYRPWPTWTQLWSDFQWLESGLQPAVAEDVD